MIRFPEYGFSLLTPAKCASTSVKLLAFQIVHGSDHEYLERDGKKLRPHNLYPTRSFEKELALDPVGDVFAVVRDPESRILSCYINRVHDYHGVRDAQHPQMVAEAGLGSYPTLDEFLDNLDLLCAASKDIRWHSRPLSFFLGTDPSYFAGIFHIGQLEALRERLAPYVGRPLPDLKRRMEARALAKKRPKLTDRQRAIIRKRYAEDYDIFGAYFARPAENPNISRVAGA